MTIDERLNFVVNTAFDGWHHVSKRTNTTKGAHVYFVGDLSTFDWTVLTRLVLAAHAVRVRVELQPAGPRGFRVLMSCRVNLPESWSEHHPDLDDLIGDATTMKTKLPTETTPTT